MKKTSNDVIENVTLTAKQIKNRIEECVSYDYKKYGDVDILFTRKESEYQKLPFCDYKVSISEELKHQQLLLSSLHEYIEDSKVDMIEYHPEEVTVEAEEVKEEEQEVNIIEEICEFDEIDDEYEEEEIEEEIDDAYDGEKALLPNNKKVKKPSMTVIKMVDVAAIVEKIKRNGIEKHKGEPVLGRRQINKMLKPYIINHTGDEFVADKDVLTSIDIYLNAVDKIANIQDNDVNKNPNETLGLNIDELLKDLKNDDLID